MSMTTAAELSKDIQELQSLIETSERPNVRSVLDKTLKEWRVQLNTVKPSTVPLAESNAIRPLKKLTTYAFDEGDKYVKLYYHLPGAESLGASNIASTFLEDSFHVICKDLNGIDYEISARGFVQHVDPEKSIVKAKSDSLLVMLKKGRDGQMWGSLLKLEKQKDANKLPKMDEGTDPQESLMTLMKQMYDDGDDQMKQTIRKAWHESQSKKKGGLDEI